MVAIANNTTERIGKFDMRIKCTERSAESDVRWHRRSDALASWLLEEWQRQQREIAERN